MPEKISERLNGLSIREQKELRKLFDVFVDDLTKLRTSITGITAKLDLDATVTDTDYAALHDPAALDTQK